jgi:hypothetical protein
VRKIISILVALGLVLAFSVVAMPTAAAAPCAGVIISPACAATAATYTINFTAPATLTPANDKLSFDFGAGTTFGTFLAGDITVNGNNVDVTKVVKSGTHLEFPVPGAVVIVAGTPVTVVIAKVTNPAVAGSYSLGLDYKLVCCDPVVFCTVSYTIIPASSTYGFFWDSSMTYPGVALGFVPPFKVCGQENFPGLNLTGKWANLVNFWLKPTLIGCNAPCSRALNLTLNVTVAPAGSNVTLSFNGTTYYPVKGTPMYIGNPVTLGNNTTLNFSAAIHFDSVGDYQICLDAFCPPGAGSCDTGCNPQGSSVANKCWDISVYQFKTACKIPLARKWNLISLPLVPLEEDQPIADVLAALPNASTLVKSIYYFDECTGEWSVWGNGQSSLTTLEDGVSYWVKIEYSHTDPLKAPGLSVGGLWVWGTPKPVPPNSPSAYPVCTGWNMVGYTEGCPTTMLDSAYLWNFVGSYGAVYGWNAATQMWDATFAPGTVNMVPGKGYWVSFAKAGFIYPP